jgi:general secretion pathway protein C
MSETFVKWGLRLAMTMLGLLCLYLGWDTTRLLTRSASLSLASSAPPPSPAEMMTSQPRLSNRSVYQSIVRRNPFGIAGEAPPNALGIDIAALEKTKLDLKLWGTVHGSNGTTYAVIEMPRQKKQALYRVGEYIQDARIRLILRHKVVLSVNGRDEVLDLHQSLHPATRGKSPPLSAKAPDRSQQIAVDPGLLSAWLEKPELHAQHAELEAITTSDGEEGVALKKVSAGSIFRKIGLSQGDTIVSADDATVDTPEDVPALLQELASTGELVMEVRRRGKPLSIRYVLRDPEIYPQDN